MKLFILGVKNSKISVYDQTRIASAFSKLFAEGIDIQIDWTDTNLPLTYKSFDDTSDIKGLFGLDGIKAQLRDTGLIPQDYYHIVIFFYSSELQTTAYWTYPEGIYPTNTVFIEIPMRPEWDSIEKAICHETLHAMHRLLAWEGKEAFADDTMDSDLDGDGQYDGDNDPMTGANYQRNLTQLRKNWLSIPVPKNRLLISYLQTLVEYIKSLLAKKDMIDKFCEAIKTHEGYSIGSRSSRNNNPGNVLFVGQLNATKDKDGFAVFKTYQEGYNYLYTMIKNACTGKSKIHSPEETIEQFINIYAPPSENNTTAYVDFIAGRLGVSKLTKLKELL